MAKISTYPIVSVPTVNDLLIGTDVENLNETKNFSIGDIASLIIGGAYVPYVGATGNVNLGSFSITASSFIVPGGLATQFVKADGTLDSTVYQPAGNYITQLSGEATASGPGNASVTLSNSAVINKVLTGLTITGSAIVSTDSILTAFGKVQNQINTLVGGVQYKGTWNAATNTPTLQSSVGVQGNYYVVSVAGNTNLNGITDWNLGDWAIFNGSAWEKVDNTDAVISVNGQVGAVVLTTTNIAEGTNLYYTDLRARQAISLTTTGNSGASTYSYLTGILNVPNYTLAGLGGVPSTRQLTINGTAFDLSADRSWSVGTVTSIATTGPLTGGTITGSGTIGITQASASSDGYLSSTDWTTFNNKQNAIINPVTGTGTPNTLPMWGSSSSLINSPLSYAADTFSFQYNSATGGTVNFTNIGLTAYTYSIQMNNFGSPRSTIHSYTDGLVIQSIGGTQVSRMFANGNLILGTGAVDNGYKLEITGSLFVNSIANATIDTDKFIVSDGGVIKYRTGAEVLSDIGAVSSVGLTMPAAFTVSNSPITSAGTIAVTGAGNASQYVRGDGTLADFPSSGGGGGSSVSYYLNGSVSQGTIGGVAYRELSKVPIFGTGTDISINADGYIASFITDAGDPNLLEIPAGNWNFETYFSASSGGGSPTFYVELYKYNGTTFTLIASNSGTPELISFGTNIEPYFSALAVPQTTLLATDRLAVRYYVVHSGRTITLHTENGHLCQIITTFTTGLTALNGLTAQVQYFQVGTTGTDFNIASATATHTFNLPTASALNRGALSSADWTTFNNKQDALINPVTGTGSAGQVAYFTGTTAITGEANLFWDSTNDRLGIGTVTPVDNFSIIASTSQAGFSVGVANTQVFLRYNNYFSGGQLVSDATKGSAQIGIGRTSEGVITFWTNSAGSGIPIERWRITETGVLQSNGLQTIQTSTGNLTLATGGGDGNIFLSPNGIGKVGIGTTAVGNFDSVPLLVVGGGTADSGIVIYTSNATSGYLQFADGTSGAEEYRGFIKYDHSLNAMSFSTNSTARTEAEMTINSSGDVGIGTATPNIGSLVGTVLTINGTTQSNLEMASAGASRARIASSSSDTTFETRSALPLVFGTNSTARWQITSTGIFQSNGSQTIQTSTGNLILTSADNTGIVDIQRNIRANGAELRLSNASNSSSWVAGDIVGTINFYLPNDTSTTQPIRSQIQAISSGGTTYAQAMNLTFSTANANTLTEGFRLTALSNVHIGPFTTDGGQKLQVTGTSLFTDTATFSVDAVVNGVNIGLGGGAISSNTRVGAGSLIANTTGTSNSAFGTSSGDSNTTGTDNTYIGAIAGQRNTTGSQNVFVGERAGRFIANGSTALTITNNSIFIGRDSRALADSQTNQIVIGHTAIGNGSNTVTIGNSSVTDNYFIGNIRGGAFIKSGGTSAQFLKADGSVDSTVYGTGTVTSVAALTIGTTGTDLSSTVATGTTTPVITLNVPSASALNRGALTAADWTTFNGKQAALNGTGFVKISGTTISYDNSTYLTTSSAASTYLPLAGGTLTGTLNGTTAVFSNTVTGYQGIFGDVSDGLIISYYTNAGGFGAIYPKTVTPNNSNYALIASSNSTILNTATGGSVSLSIGNTEQWQITSTGVFQSNGAKTIQTSTGNLTLATAAGNGNILLSPNGTGNVGVGTTPSGAKLDVLGNFRVRRDVFANQYLDITSGGGFVNLLAYNGNSSTIYQELIFQSGNTTDTVERWKITSTGVLQSNGSQTIQTSTGNLILTSADNTGIVDIRRNDRALGAELRISNSANSSAWVAGDIVGTLNFYLPSDTSTTQPIRSQIQAISTSGTTYPTSMNLKFSTANANTLTEGFRLTALSNVHIGPFTSDNGARLQVVGTGVAFNFTTSNGLIGNINSSAANGGYVTWQTSGTTIADLGTAQQIFTAGGNDTFGINARGARSLILGTNNTARLTIDSAGNVSIGTTTPNSKLQVLGSFSAPHVTKTANYTLDATDYTVGFDCAISRTATLPDATTCLGRIYVIYQYNTNLGLRYVTLDGNGSQTINGLTTYSLSNLCDYSSVMIQSNGSNWIVIANAVEICPV